ncbi:hypothetical protein BLA29_014952, partial [Euroglyphus maynei]
MDKVIENANDGDDCENQFSKQTSDQLIEQLDKLEYNGGGCVGVGRISLYRQFDPLVNTSFKMPATTLSSANDTSNQPETVNDGGDGEFEQNP